MMDSQKKTKHKEKRRNNEKRKERSRDAARCRRSRETDIFTELAAALPISGEQAQHLDKASIMRLAIAYLKGRAVVDSVPELSPEKESMSKMDHLFAKALNGFMLVLSSDGNMVYLSENVSEYLGISQMDMMGQNVYEYSHPCDHDELRDCLTVKPTENNNEKRVCSFFLRLKCTLTSKGRKVNLKSASYKVIHCIGRLVKIRETISNSHKFDIEEEEEDEDGDNSEGGSDSSKQQCKEKDQTSEDEANDCDTGFSLVMVACPIPHPSNIEIPLGRQTFLSKHSLSMKFTYADEKLAEYLGWSSDELMGQSVFEFHHALDNLALDKSFKSLFSKGQCETMAYRFLGKKGGYAWVVTQATLIHCSKQHKPLSVVCVNYIISGVEREDEIYSARQLAARNSVSSTLEKEHEQQQQPQQQQQQLIVTTTKELLVVPDEITSIVEQSKEHPSEFVLQPTPTDLLPTAKTLLETRAKPLSVTASLFRFANNNNNNTSNHTDLKKPEEPRKEYVTAVPPTLVVDDNNTIYKENNDPRILTNKTQAPERPTFIFQGKPAIQYDPSTLQQHRPRPQAVTRNLFVPLVSATQPQQQQQQSSPGSQQQEPLIVRPPPQSATASIFAPRTEDMNKGFLTFSEDQPGLTMLKDEPEDLTHLAPTPGDVCVPLEDTPFFSDMLDEFILGNDNYCSLLSPSGVLSSELRTTELNSDPLKDTDFVEDSMKLKNRLGVSSLADCDPFMYGDSPDSPCSDGPSTDSISLGNYRQSPEQSADSLGSPIGGGSGAEGLSEDEMLMLGISDSLADDELALRAPYIPMSDQDEALELLISDDMVMWGPNETNNKESSKWLVDEKDQRGGSDSSLAQLLKADSAVNRRYNDHGGGLVNPVQVLGQTCRKNPTSGTSTRSWPSTKSDRLDRPNKRNHTLSTSGIDNKRIKCEDSIVLNRLENNFDLENSYPATNKKNHTSSRKHTMVTSQQQQQQQQQQLAGSQLLRRLVSQENITRLMEKSNNNNFNRNVGNNNNNSSNNPKKLLSTNGFHEDNDDDQDNNEDDGGGGGKTQFIDKNYPKLHNIVTTTNIQQNQYPPSNSVLMNLLVSGCDDINTNNMINSCNVPLLLDKNYTSPLTVDLDNQTVPQYYSPNPRDVVTSNLHHLSPDTRKQLIGCLSGIGNATTTIDSPTTFMCMDDDNGDDNTTTSATDLLRNFELSAIPSSRNFV